MDERIKVYVCSNRETLSDRVIEDGECYESEIGQAVSEVCRDLDDAGFDGCRAQHFSDWHGGKFYQAGNVLGGKKYGYRNGHVATLAVDPSEELIAAINRASDALDEKLAAIGKAESERG